MQLFSTNFHLSAWKQTPDDLPMLLTSINKKSNNKLVLLFFKEEENCLKDECVNSLRTTTLDHVLCEVLEKQKSGRQGLTSRNFPVKSISHPPEMTGNQKSSRGEGEGWTTAVRAGLLTSYEFDEKF